MAEMVSTVRHSGAGGKRDGHSSKQDAQRKQKKKGGAVLRVEGVDSRARGRATHTPLRSVGTNVWAPRKQAESDGVRHDVLPQRRRTVTQTSTAIAALVERREQQPCAQTEERVQHDGPVACGV